MTARAVVREADLTRIFRAAKKADYPVQVTLPPDGGIVIRPMSRKDDGDVNPWDEDDGPE